MSVKMGLFLNDDEVISLFLNMMDKKA